MDGETIYRTYENLLTSIEREIVSRLLRDIRLNHAETSACASLNGMNQTKAPLLVVLIAGIGDLVLGSMGLRAIRHGFPRAEIHLMTSVESVGIARCYPYVDKVWTFPIRQFRKNKKTFVNTVKALLPLRAYRFEKIINLYQVASIGGALAMGTVFSLLRSPCKIGHNRYGFGFFLNEKAPEDFFQDRHMADSILDLACMAGGKADGEGIEVFPPGSIDASIKKMLDFAPDNSGLKTVAINPGSDAVEKRTDPIILSSAVNRLAARIPIKSIILGGPGEEVIAAKIFQNIQTPSINLAGKISLEELVYVLDQVDLLITNDSGPMHIAAALKKPLVALFKKGNNNIFGPYGDSKRFRTINAGSCLSIQNMPYQKDIDSKVANLSWALLNGW